MIINTIFSCKRSLFNIILSLFLIKIEFTKEYLVFPIYTYKTNDSEKNNNSKISDSEQFLSYCLNNSIYTYFYLGTPPSKIYTYLDLYKPELYLDDSICSLKSTYNINTSSTFYISNNCTFYYYTSSQICNANETFNFYTEFNFKNTISIDNIEFLQLITNKLKTGFSCMHLGLQLPREYSQNYIDNLIDQLKKSDHIESKYWTIEYIDNLKYDENNNLIDGYLIIGSPPHVYNPNKYKYNNYRSSVAEIKTYYIDHIETSWGIIFDSMFFINKTDNKEIYAQNTKCIFDIGINFIKGTDEYLKMIEESFFENLYNKSICYKDIIFYKNENYEIIFCKKNYYEEIKKFPTLYMISSQLEYKFELTYNDLFFEQNDNLFFNIIFTKEKTKFTFGKIFLKKYFFTFSFDNKLIGFYNSNDFDKINDNNYTIIFILIGILLIVLGLILVFYLLYKFKICGRRQKRVNELNDDSYDYMVNKNNDSIN